MKGRTIVDSNVHIVGNDTTWIRMGRYCHIQRYTYIIPPTLPILNKFINVRKNIILKERRILDDNDNKDNKQDNY